MPAAISTLTLPEPAGGLYRAARESLDEFLPTVIDEGGGWWLGGGTVLAAQWRHRLSTDLDVFLPGSASLTPFDPRWSPDFRDAMRRLGATRLEAQPRSIKAWFPSGRLEVTALDPVPPLPPRNVRIDGRGALVLANGSILCGKLHGRGRRLPERDVFDPCVAAEEDPEALCCAVNHVGPDARREMLHVLTMDADGFRRSAPSVILDPAPRFARLGLQEMMLARHGTVRGFVGHVNTRLGTGAGRLG